MNCFGKHINLFFLAGARVLGLDFNDRHGGATMWIQRERRCFGSILLRFCGTGQPARPVLVCRNPEICDRIWPICSLDFSWHDEPNADSGANTVFCRLLIVTASHQLAPFLSPVLDPFHPGINTIASESLGFPHNVAPFGWLQQLPAALDALLRESRDNALSDLVKVARSQGQNSRPSA